MEAYLDTVGCGTTPIVAIYHEADNTLSVMGIENDDELSYLGCNSILEIGNHETKRYVDDDGECHQITRIL